MPHFCERDSSGTTRASAKRGAGDGADSPTRAAEGGEAARPNFYSSEGIFFYFFCGFLLFWNNICKNIQINAYFCFTLYYFFTQHNFPQDYEDMVSNSFRLHGVICFWRG